MRLLVTGGSGFVGTRFLAALAEAEPEWSLRCLLFTEIECVVHLAAATGRADANTYDIVNRRATVELIQAAEQAGVSRFVFVSSVAAGFTDTKFYPYAWSKRDAEDALRDTSMDVIIVRPTMILGRGSAIAAGLRSLAGGPALLLPGSGTHTVQPVAVDDVVRAIRRALEPAVTPGLYGVGGPSCVTMRSLLERIRTALGKGTGPTFRLPLHILRTSLGVIESFVGPRLPVTAAQFASSANPGVVTHLPQLVEATVGLDIMIDDSLAGE